MAMSVRITVAVAKRLGRRRSSLGELHRPTLTPAPVVASIGSICSTRRAAINELSTPRVISSTDQKIDGTGLEPQLQPADVAADERDVQQRADDQSETDDDDDLDEQRRDEPPRGRADRPQQASASSPSGT